MYRIFIFLLLCRLIAPIQSVNAQESEQKDSIPVHRVILVPYDPRYYLSDADRDIAAQTNNDPQRIRTNFRQVIDRHVQRAVNGTYECISLLNDTADRLDATLGEIIGHTGYRYEKAIPITPKTQRIEKLLTLDGKDVEEHQDSRIATQYIPAAEDAMYMRAIVSHPLELFSKLQEEYDADLFIFLTQLEIKTNYKSCLDIANKVYRREIMLHFTIYDVNGNLVAGSYATAYFPSDSNHAGTIMGNCFPTLAAYVAGCLP